MTYKIQQVSLISSIIACAMFGFSTTVLAAVANPLSHKTTIEANTPKSESVILCQEADHMQRVNYDGKYPSDPILLAYTNAFVFSPRKLRWYAYDSKGRLIRSGRASGGRGYCPDIKRSCRTPVGHFRIVRKGGPGCKSGKYPLPRGGAPMPYCSFFSKYYAIHGSYHVPRYNASHGCIRVHPSAARWLSRNFLNHGRKVIVLPY